MPTILIAPSGFKECLDAPEVAHAIAAGVRRVLPGATMRLVPIADGGEGFTRALVAATDGWQNMHLVSGPTGLPTAAPVGFLGGERRRTAVIEMAAAAGLRLVPPGDRDPGLTTTLGVGELIRHALDGGAREIVLGCGDSGTNDGGLGAAAALGARFLDRAGRELPARGMSLGAICDIDLSSMDGRLRDTRLEVACNHRNVLCGPRGVVRVYGPQKGADGAAVEILSAGLERYADVIERVTGVDVRGMAGGGASGGLGAGLAAFCGARLIPRWDVITRYLEIESLIGTADLVITAEGSLDGQTPQGKIPAEIGRRARALGVPTIALAGTLGSGVEENLAAGITAYAGVLQRPCTLSEAIRDTARLLSDAAEHAMRMLQVGARVFPAAA